MPRENTHGSLIMSIIILLLLLSIVYTTFPLGTAVASGLTMQSWSKNFLFWTVWENLFSSTFFTSNLGLTLSNNSREITCLLRLQFCKTNSSGGQLGKNLGRFADEKCWTDNKDWKWTFFHNMFWKLMFSLVYLERSEFSNIQTSWQCSQKWYFELEKILYSVSSCLKDRCCLVFSKFIIKSIYSLIHYLSC